jgi:hypothetical protein
MRGALARGGQRGFGLGRSYQPLPQLQGPRQYFGDHVGNAFVIAFVKHAPLFRGGKLVDGCQQFQVLRGVTGREQMYEHIAARRDFSARQRDLAVAAAQGQQFVLVVENHVCSFTQRRVVGANSLYDVTRIRPVQYRQSRFSLMVQYLGLAARL